MKSILLVYLSPGGNTETLARIIGEKLTEKNLNIEFLNLFGYSKEKIDKIDYSALLQYDIIGIGTPVYTWTMLPPIEQFIENIPKASQIEKYPSFFSFCTYGKVSTGRTLYRMAKKAHKKGYPVLGGLKIIGSHFFEPSDGVPNENQDKLIITFVSQILDKNRNEISWKRLKKFLKYQPLWLRIIAPMVEKFGQKFMKKVSIIENECTDCRLCQDFSPTANITLNNGPEFADSCLHCYNCVTKCPNNVFTADLESLQEFVESMRKKIKENPKEDFYI